jgi:hypothetical protein
MESTGVYWKPVFNILEGRVAVILVNAEQPPTPPIHACSAVRPPRRG